APTIVGRVVGVGPAHQVVGVAIQSTNLSRNAQRQPFVHQWYGHAAFVVAKTVVADSDGGVALGFETGLLGCYQHRTGGGIAPEQRALRPLQYLNVRQVESRYELRFILQRNLVEIDGDRSGAFPQRQARLTAKLDRRIVAATRGHETQAWRQL